MDDLWDRTLARGEAPNFGAMSSSGPLHSEEHESFCDKSLAGQSV